MLRLLFYFLLNFGWSWCLCGLCWLCNILLNSESNSGIGRTLTLLLILFSLRLSLLLLLFDDVFGFLSLGLLNHWPCHSRGLYINLIFLTYSDLLWWLLPTLTCRGPTHILMSSTVSITILCRRWRLLLRELCRLLFLFVDRILDLDLCCLFSWGSYRGTRLARAIQI